MHGGHIIFSFFWYIIIIIIIFLPNKLSVPVSIMQWPNIFCQLSHVWKISGILDPPLFPAMIPDYLES